MTTYSSDGAVSVRRARGDGRRADPQKFRRAVGSPLADDGPVNSRRFAGEAGGDQVTYRVRARAVGSVAWCGLRGGMRAPSRHSINRLAALILSERKGHPFDRNGEVRAVRCSRSAASQACVLGHGRRRRELGSEPRAPRHPNGQPRRKPPLPSVNHHIDTRRSTLARRSDVNMRNPLHNQC